MGSLAKIMLLVCFLQAMVLVESYCTCQEEEAPVNDAFPKVLRGRDGHDGVKGERGDTGCKGEKGATGSPAPNNGGVVYIRWGRTTCPNDTGAELVYDGITSGSSWVLTGGGANYLCSPKVPEYLSNATTAWHSYLDGTEYETNNVIFSNHDHNIPCAVCDTSKGRKLMIPAKTTCPTSWTREYYGYLMSERDVHGRNAVYECMDINPESIPGGNADIGHAGSAIYFVLSRCNNFPCPPYVENRAITCVVCTK